MSENERIQPERTSTPPLQKGYWVSGILSFVLVLISYLGVVFPILPDVINVAMLVGAATVLISASLILSFLNAREQNLKTILYEIRRYSARESSDFLKTLPGILSLEHIESSLSKIIAKSTKRGALVRHAYRVALMEGQSKVSEDLMNELEWVSQFQSGILHLASQFAKEKGKDLNSIYRQLVKAIQLVKEVDSIQDPEARAVVEKNIEETIRGIDDFLKEGL